MKCPFCRKIRDQKSADVLYRDDRIAVLSDAYPLTQGHLLIVPTRHVAHLSELDPDEYRALFDEVWVQISNHSTDYTIGVNDGPAAGQTIPHVHIHVVPRAFGDTTDPRGGVRWVIPERAAYYLTTSHRSPAIETAELLRNLRHRYEAASITIWRTTLARIAAQVATDPVAVRVYRSDLASTQPPRVEVHTATETIVLDPDRIASELVAMVLAAPEWAVVCVSQGKDSWFEASLKS